MIQAPVNGQCPAGTEPILRVYNAGAMNGMGSNHRFVSDSTLDQDMMDRGWLSEGTAFCAPVGATGTVAPMMPAGSGFASLANTWTGSSNWVYAPTGAQAVVDTGVALSLTITDAGAVTGSGNGCTIAGTVTKADGFRQFFTGTATLANCTHSEFNGTLPLRVESVAGGRLLMAHMHLAGAASLADITALLNASTTPPALPVTGSWNGTAAWIDAAAQRPSGQMGAGGAGQMPGAVNQPLVLNLDNGVLTGSGYGCTFTGKVVAAGEVSLTGTLSAAGCTDANFNGSYDQVSLVLAGKALAVNLGKGMLNAGMNMGNGLGVRIVGVLPTT
jgi:hypothetical protein